MVQQMHRDTLQRKHTKRTEKYDKIGPFSSSEEAGGELKKKTKTLLHAQIKSSREKKSMQRGKEHKIINSE